MALVEVVETHRQQMQGDDRQQDVEQRVAMPARDAAALAVIDIAG